MSQRINLSAVSPGARAQAWEGLDLLRIGRDQDSQVRLNDTSVSRCHAELYSVEPLGWFVRDVGSTNGTYLNGVRIGWEERQIREGDLLQVGNVVLRVVGMQQSDATPLDSFTGTAQVEATTQRSWEEVFDVVAGHMAQRSCTDSQFLGLLRVGHDLHQHHSLDELLCKSLDEAAQMLNARGAALVLLDEATGQLTLQAATPLANEAPATRCFTKTLAQRCLARGESLLGRDIRSDGELQSAASVSSGSSVLCALLRSPRRHLGVLHLDREPQDKPFTVVDLHVADAIAASIAGSIESAQFFMAKQRSWFIQTIIALAQTIELRDPYTAGHSKRVTRYALLLADALKLPPQERRHIEIGGQLHDIGKIGICDTVLRKTGKLSPAEDQDMQSHTVKGAAIVAGIPELAPVLPIVRNHHERWNGRGYPDRLAGEAIPLAARIVAVADSFDAMTSNRPYRTGLSVDEAFRQVEHAAGTQFDPECSRAFLGLRHHIAQFVPRNKPATAVERTPDEEWAAFEAEYVPA
jgi:putative nucleotidyltransferase with HDIG domain